MGRITLLATILSVAACGSDPPVSGQTDAEPVGDTGADAGVETGADAGVDTGADAADSGWDLGSDPEDTSDDTGEDSGGPPAPPIGDLLLNEVFCHGPDFVELYNADDIAVELEGLILTDDPSDSDRDFVLAQQALDPGEHLLIRRADADAGVPGFPFGVKCGDDRISLLARDRTVHDSHEVPELPVTATSSCRLPDAGPWDVCAVTPGEVNEEAPLSPDDWFAEPIIRRIEITMTEEAQRVLLASPRTDVEVLLGVPDEGVEPMRVMMRLKGRRGSFRPLDEKAGFRIDINDVVSGQRLFGLKQLTLNNMVQDRSLVHEFASYELFRALGLAAPRVTYAEVTVNEELYGLYASIEGYDSISLEQWFPETNHLYEGLYGEDLFMEQIYDIDMDEGDPSDRSDLRWMAETLDRVGVEGLYEATLDAVDWRHVARMMAVEMWIDHWDGYARYRNNFFFHFDGEIVLRLLPWGTDQTFVDQNSVLEGRGYLFNACLAHPDCAAMYFDGLLETGRAVEEIDLIRRLVDLELELWPVADRDPRRSYSMESHDSAFDGVLRFLREREANVVEQVGCLTGGNPDPDGDGSLCDQDCRPDDPLSYPGAPEICSDGIDQDCSGVPDDALECPDCIETPILGATYWICPTPRDYEGAQAHCAAQGARMVKIDSREENDAVYAAAQAVREQDYWLGMDDRDEEGTFLWADGSPVEFERWHAGEPNDWGEGEDCAAFWSDDHWNDYYCDRELGVICEALSEP